MIEWYERNMSKWVAIDGQSVAGFVRARKGSNFHIHGKWYFDAICHNGAYEGFETIDEAKAYVDTTWSLKSISAA